MPGKPFTTASATVASKKGVAVRAVNRGKRKIANLSPEAIVTATLGFLVDGMLNPQSPPYVKMGSARTLLTTLYGAGVKPSQRDLAVIFRKLHASPEPDGASRAGEQSNSQMNDGANDASDEATPPAKE